jgi:hypothetical protein
MTLALTVIGPAAGQTLETSRRSSGMVALRPSLDMTSPGSQLTAKHRNSTENQLFVKTATQQPAFTVARRSDFLVVLTSRHGCRRGRRGFSGWRDELADASKRRGRGGMTVVWPSA